MALVKQLPSGLEVVALQVGPTSNLDVSERRRVILRDSFEDDVEINVSLAEAVGALRQALSDPNISARPLIMDHIRKLRACSDRFSEEDLTLEQEGPIRLDREDFTKTVSLLGKTVSAADVVTFSLYLMESTPLYNDNDPRQIFIDSLISSVESS